MTSHQGQVFIQIVLLSHLSAFRKVVSLARLVKAEIVSPYSGILINTGVGNPTAPFTTALGRKASFTRLVGMHVFVCPYKGIKIQPFYLHLLPPWLIHLRELELQHPSPHISPQPSPTMSRAGGKWMASSVTEGHIQKLRSAGHIWRRLR